MIYVAGTSISQELVRSDVSQILSETLLSDHQVSAHTDTYTSNTDLIAQMEKNPTRTGHRQRLNMTFWISRFSNNKCYVFSCDYVCVNFIFLLDESLMLRVRV